MRHAITRLDAVLPQYDSHMLLQVYDSLLIEVPKSALAEVTPIISTEMTRDFPFTVPLAVELKAGKSWGSQEAT